MHVAVGVALTLVPVGIMLASIRSAMPSANTATPLSWPEARRLTIAPTIVSTTRLQVELVATEFLGNNRQRRARRFAHR